MGSKVEEHLGVPARGVAPNPKTVPGYCLHVGTGIVLRTDPLTAGANQGDQAATLAGQGDVKPGKNEGICILVDKELLQKIVQKILLITARNGELHAIHGPNSIQINHHSGKSPASIGKKGFEIRGIHADNDIGHVIQKPEGHA